MAQTKTIRIAVAIDSNGRWCASGCNDWDDSTAMDCAIEGVDPGEAHFFITAELPIQAVDIPGKVEPA